MDTHVQYEETPPIEPMHEVSPDMAPSPKPKNSFFSILTTIIFFIILFIIGFWLSGYVRQYAGTFFKGNEKQTTVPTPTPKVVGGILTPTTMVEPADAVWKTYQVLSGQTRLPYEGISYTLPPDVLSPICDGSTCRSQGTYLPGGTRFTVALRGEGQILPDFRKGAISDLKGIPFPVKEKMLKGYTVTEFSGTFVGTTVAGYVFTQMRGYMIPLTDTISMEINHFTPSGILTDFAADDIVFNSIVDSLILPTSPKEKGGVSPDQIGVSSSSATPATEQ